MVQAAIKANNGSKRGFIKFALNKLKEKTAQDTQNSSTPVWYCQFVLQNTTILAQYMLNKNAIV